MLKKLKLLEDVGLCIGKKAHDKVWPEVAEWIKINYVNLLNNLKSPPI